MTRLCATLPSKGLHLAAPAGVGDRVSAIGEIKTMIGLRTFVRHCVPTGSSDDGDWEIVEMEQPLIKRSAGACCDYPI